MSELDSIEKLPASRADLIALDDKLRGVQKIVQDFQKEVPDATNSIGQINARIEKMEDAISEIQEILKEAMPVIHDHEDAGEGLSTEMKFAVLDFLKEVDGMPATDDDFATNPDGTPKKQKKKDVGNQFVGGAEVQLNDEDPGDADKFADLERKVDTMMKKIDAPFYRGTDVDTQPTEDGDRYMEQILKAHGM